MNNIGSTPFGNMVWFIGVIEDIDDQDGKVNRYRVRCVGYHTENKALLPTEDLPWAPMLNNGSQMSTPIIYPGEWVVGFFLDGAEAQQPVIFGSITGITNEKDPSVGFNDPSGTFPRETGVPSNPALARGVDDGSVAYRKNTAAKSIPTASGGNWSEPATPYAAKYPNNHVIYTDASNIIELDETEGSQRVHVFHRSGSFVEFHPNGDVVYRSLKNKYDVTFGDNNVYVNGKLNITVAGDADIAVGGKTTISSKGDVKWVVGGSFELDVQGSYKVAASGSITIDTSAGIDMGGSSIVAIHSGGTLSLDGSSLDLNGRGASGGSGASGSPVSVSSQSRSPYKS